MQDNKAILIVDDEFIILESLRMQLTNFLDGSIILEAATSAEEAIGVIDEFYENKIDLILLISDYHLDTVKGTEVLLHAMQKFPNVHKAILSGQSDEEVATEIKKQIGSVDFITKPWDFEDIKKIINGALYKKK